MTALPPCAVRDGLLVSRWLLLSRFGEWPGFRQDAELRVWEWCLGGSRLGWGAGWKGREEEWGGWVGVAVGGTLLRSWSFWNQSGVRGFGFSSFAVVASTSYFLFQTGCELF